MIRCEVAGTGVYVAPSGAEDTLTATATGEGGAATSSGAAATLPVAQPVHNLNILKVHTSASVKALSKEPEWVEIELGGDSGASETVIGPNLISNVALSQGEQFQKGVQYEIATGDLIPKSG